MRHFAWACVTTLLAALGLPQPGPCRGDDGLTKRIETIIDAPRFKHAHWGLLVVDMSTGEVVYERNADKLFAPASTTKLFSVAAALDELGADHRFETPVYAHGTIDAEGRLNGHLILVASGDLTLGGRTLSDDRIAFVDNDHTYAAFSDTSEWTSPNPLAGFDELARQIAAAGIKHVHGDVVVDDRLFDPATSTGSGPSRLTPVIVNDNVVDVMIKPAAVGEPATVDWRPKVSTIAVDARVETVASEKRTSIDVTSPEPGRIVIRGRIAAGAAPVVRIHEIDDPASVARTALVESLERAGVRVDGSPLAANDDSELPPRDGYAPLKRVATLKSPPLSENAKLILKVSHNLHASTLPLLVAAKHGQRSLAEGLRRQHDALVKLGVEVDTISFGGGAGGDRADYVTPRATVQLLRAMAKRPDFQHYRAALPSLGVDGTLAKAIASDSAAKGKVQAKTGTLLWPNVMNGGFILTSKALAGYVGDSDAAPRLAFAMFVNQVPLADRNDREEVGRTLGKLCEELAK